MKFLFLACAAGVSLLGNCMDWRASALSRFLQGKVPAAASEGIDKAEAAELQKLRWAGAYAEGRKRAELFLSKRANSAALHLELGRILSEIGVYQSAEKHFRNAIASASSEYTTRALATRELGDLLEGTGRRSEARILWDQILDRYQREGARGSQVLGVVAVAAWRSGYIKDANSLFIDATDPKIGPVSIEALADFGYLFLEKYQPSEAISVFRDCLKMNEHYARALLGIALAKKYDNALEVEAYSGMALKENPNMTGAFNALAQLSIEEEDFPSALRHLDAALAVNPSNLESLSLRAFCRYVLGDRQGFDAIERQILSIHASYGRFYHVLADNLVSRRKYQEAVDWSRKAITLDPELWPAYATLGMNLMRVGELDEGRKAIQQAFDGDPSNVWALNTLDLFDQMDTFVRGESEHFIFRMSKDDDAALGSFASALAEEAYDKLTRRYGFKPAGPLQVEVFPDHEGFAVRTLGLPGLSGALGVCFGKVIALDSPRAREKGAFNWGATLWHEFVHVMTLQMTNHNIPRWFTEGLSVYEERRARPGWGDPLTVDFLRAYQAGKLMKASELNAGFVRPTSPEQVMLAYYQAGLICEMMEARYGFDKIRQSLLLFAENRPAEEVFRRTLGLSPLQLDEAYARYLDAHFKDIASRVRFPQSGPEEKSRLAAPDKAALLRQLETDPNDFWANLALGRLLRKENRNAEAEAPLIKARQFFPQYVEAGNPYELLGQIYMELKRESEALAQFIDWSQFNGSAREPLLKAAEIYRSRKDWASVVERLHLSIFINPYDQGVQKQLGDAAMECGKWAIAASAYRTLVGLNASNRAGAHYDLARALLAQGNKKDARREILRSLELAPSFRQAQEMLLKLSGDAE